MTESARQLVRKGFDHAVEQAFPVLKAKLQSLPLEAQDRALQSAAGIRTCLETLVEGAVPSPETHESLIRLLFGHGDPQVVEALKEYAEVLNFYLMDARDRLVQARTRLDS